MGNVFPSALQGTTRTATADAEPVTPPARPVGARLCLSALFVPVSCSCFRDSVWRRVERGCTHTTRPATTVTHPAAPVWDPWPQTVCAVSNPSRSWSCSIPALNTESAPPNAPSSASGTVNMSAEIATRPACSALVRPQTPACPARLSALCQEDAVCHRVLRGATARRASVKAATHPASPARDRPRQTALPVPPEPLCTAATAGRPVGRGSTSAPPPGAATDAVRTVSAAPLTSTPQGAACVCGVEHLEPGCLEITVFLSVQRRTLLTMEPVSNAILHVGHAAGRGLCPVLPVPLPSSCYDLESAHHPVHMGFTRTPTGSATNVTPSVSHARPRERARRVETPIKYCSLESVSMTAARTSTT